MSLLNKIFARYEVVSSRKQRYLDFLKDLPYPDEHKQKIVKDAIDTFEREDRIMWFLRKARAADLAELAAFPDEHFDQYKNQLGDEGVQKLKAGKETAKRKLERMIQAPLDSAKGKERLALVQKEGEKLGEILTNMRHHIQNAKIHKLQSVLDYNFPPNAHAVKLYSDLKALEDKEMSKKPDERFLKPSDEESNFLEFPDGWKWFYLDRKTCEREAKSMRHCGNSAGHSGDKILSLREPLQVDVGEGRRKRKELYYKPHATFIINDGVVGEMKGYANSKPEKALHKYIIPLLEDKRIEGIRGGGYAANKNFTLNDLTDTERKALLKKKGADFDKEHEAEDYNEEHNDDDYNEDDDE